MTTLDENHRTAATMLAGYARCSTDRQDLTMQREMLIKLGVPEDRVYLDFGVTGRNRQRPALDQALAAVRAGDTLITPKLDRLARSVPDARDIIMSLCERGVQFQLGSAAYDWHDPMAKMFLQMLAVFAEFESDLIKMRTREGMARPEVRAKLKGKPPKLKPAQQKHLVKLYGEGEHSITELAELFSVSRPAVYRVLNRHGAISPTITTGA